MSKPKIYGVGFSPFVRKVRVFMMEKGIEHEAVEVRPRQMPDEVRKNSPLGKIPVCNIGDKWIPDSSVICAYLERLYPQTPLYPADAWDYARALWFEEFIDGGAVPKLGPTIFLERAAPIFMGRPTDEAKVAKAMTDDLPPIYDYLDQETKGKTYLVGNTLSIADIAVVSFLVNMAHSRVELDAKRWPNLAAYTARHMTRPSFSTMLATEKQLFASLTAAASTPK